MFIGMVQGSAVHCSTVADFSIEFPNREPLNREPLNHTYLFGNY